MAFIGLFWFNPSHFLRKWITSSMHPAEKGRPSLPDTDPVTSSSCRAELSMVSMSWGGLCHSSPGLRVWAPLFPRAPAPRQRLPMVRLADQRACRVCRGLRMPALAGPRVTAPSPPTGGEKVSFHTGFEDCQRTWELSVALGKLTGAGGWGNRPSDQASLPSSTDGDAGRRREQSGRTDSAADHRMDLWERSEACVYSFYSVS